MRETTWLYADSPRLPPAMEVGEIIVATCSCVGHDAIFRLRDVDVWDVDGSVEAVWDIEVDGVRTDSVSTYGMDTPSGAPPLPPPANALLPHSCTWKAVTYVPSFGSSTHRPEPWRGQEPILSIDLIPQNSWWANLRAVLTDGEWEKCKDFVKQRSGGNCEVCGQTGWQQGRRYGVECHEIWHYDEDSISQTLVGLIALCPRCHSCKHLGATAARGGLEGAMEHLAAVNQWFPPYTSRYAEHAFEVWRWRSERSYSLDMSWLTIALGTELPDDAVMQDRIAKAKLAGRHKVDREQLRRV